LLFDPQKRVKMAAIGALSELSAPQAISALERCKAVHPKQDEPKINRTIVSCKNANHQPAAKSLKKNLERMDDQISKLKSRVLELEAQIDLQQKEKPD